MNMELPKKIGKINIECTMHKTKYLTSCIFLTEMKRKLQSEPGSFVRSGSNSFLGFWKKQANVTVQSAKGH